MPPSRKPPRELFKRIRLLVLDVDGTMTDGRLYYGKDGEALKAFDVRDGHGLRDVAVRLGRDPGAHDGREGARVHRGAHDRGRVRAIGLPAGQAAGLEAAVDDDRVGGG